MSSQARHELGALGPGRFGARQALFWTLLATLGLFLSLSFLVTIWPPAARDIALLGLTQVVVYVAVLAAFVRARALPPAAALGVAPAPALAYALALLAGLALQAPCDALAELVERFWPSPPGLLEERLLRLTPLSVPHAVAIVGVVAGLGPLLEEAFFRGALFGALEREASARRAGSIVAVCFALAHLDARLFAPLLVVGLVLSYVRAVTRSIGPGLALHAAFNSATLALVFSGAMPAGRTPPLHPALVLFGSLLACGLVWALGKTSGGGRSRDSRAHAP